MVPDLALLVSKYQETGDANGFVEGTLLATDRGQTVRDRLKFLVVGNRDHNWMYDGASLISMLTDAGFKSAAEQPCGSTRIPDPGGLDLSERAEESVYVEALR